MADRRTLEERLRESQEYHRSLVEAATVPLLVVNPRLGITEVNDQATVLTGRSRRELIGTSIDEQLALPSPAVEAVRRAVDTGEPSRFDAVVRSARGTPRTVSVSVSAFVDPLGDRRGLLRVGPS